ncbi:unnamed protein product [Closterium sp. NIES-64]|nr:unnamed protein product [Closterium sp. NIES-64]
MRTIMAAPSSMVSLSTRSASALPKPPSPVATVWLTSVASAASLARPMSVMVAAEMAATGMMAAGMVAAELNADLPFSDLTVFAEMVVAERVVAQMVSAEKVPAVMVPAAVPCDHSSFAAALPSLPFSLFLRHPCGFQTHPLPLAPVHAGWPRVRRGSAAH